MESDRDHIKEIFSSKLSNFEPDLPDFVWDKIDADLSKKSVVENVPIRKKIYPIVATVAAAAAVFFAVLYLLPQQDDKVVNPIAVQSVDTLLNIDTLKVEGGSINNEALLVVNADEKESQVVKNTSNQKSQFLATTLLIDEVSTDKDDVQEVFVGNNLVNSSLDDVSLVEPILLVAEINEGVDNHVLNVDDGSFEEDLSKQMAAFESKGKELDDLLSSTDVSDKPSYGRGFQLGLEGGSGFSKANDTKNQLNALHQGSNGVTMRSSKIKLKHNQPIIFGVGISKRITNKISLETGLNYAYISSKIRSDDDRVMKQKDAQYFHYLGVPLAVNYTFSEWERFRFYSSLGVMFQKDVYGRIRSNLYSDGLYKVDETDKVKISQKHLQFSTSATLGVSYPIYDKLRVYTNFGGSYYFDAKNEYETIYSDKKWLFNLNLGVKFDF